MTGEEEPEDPFEQLEGEVGDRDGDPFENLDTETGTENVQTADESTVEDAVPTDDEPTESTEGVVPSDHETAQSGEESLRSEPGGIDQAADFEPEEIGEQFSREQPQPSPDSDGDGTADHDSSRGEPASGMEFGIGTREEGTEPTEQLSDIGRRDGDPFESVQDAFDEVDVGQVDPDIVWQQLASAESRGSVGDANERTYADVSKHSYCEQCEHFSPPPNVHCGHEGTEIVEFLDMETVRVVDCPIVTEREKLENDDGFGTE